jgi:hypothetical protein
MEDPESLNEPREAATMHVVHGRDDDHRGADLPAVSDLNWLIANHFKIFDLFFWPVPKRWGVKLAE